MNAQWYAFLNLSPKDLWSLITENGHLSAWLDPGTRLDLRRKGKLSLPGHTQFRGLVGEASVIDFVPEKKLVLSWPIKGIPTEVTMTIVAQDMGAKLVVSQDIADDANQIFPPRSNLGVLKHYWKTNLASLKFYAETGRSVDRSPLQQRDQREARHQMTYDAPIDKVWEALTVPLVMDQWLSRQAEVELRPGGKITYGWDHGADRVVEMEPLKRISHSWLIGDDESLVCWELFQRESGKTQVHFRHSGFSEKYPLRATSYTEGWFAFMLLLGLFLEKGLRTHDWSNLNEDSNT